ncbi:MAG: hypothetical protein ABH832_00965 [bacterium]
MLRSELVRVEIRAKGASNSSRESLLKAITFSGLMISVHKTESLQGVSKLSKKATSRMLFNQWSECIIGSDNDQLILMLRRYKYEFGIELWYLNKAVYPTKKMARQTLRHFIKADASELLCFK